MIGLQLPGNIGSILAKILDFGRGSSQNHQPLLWLALFSESVTPFQRALLLGKKCPALRCKIPQEPLLNHQSHVFLCEAVKQ
jgi:hypothetical protein